MNAILIVQIQRALLEANYVALMDNDPSKYKCRSPHTLKPIIIPMGVSDTLPVNFVQNLLRGEPDGEELVRQMLLGQRSES